MTSSIKKSVKWDSLQKENLTDYRPQSSVNLSNIRLNHDLLLCDNQNCQDLSHQAAIDRNYADIINALAIASKSLQQQSNVKEHSAIPG